MYRTLSALCSALMFLMLLPAAGYSTIHNISIKSFAFSPTKTVVATGDTVRWTLTDGFHTTTSDPGSPKTWNSGTLSTPGQTFQITVTAGDGAGPFPYHCDFHPTMQDTIFVVNDADGDGIPDATDNCPTVPNADQADNDNDGVGNACDNCVNNFNPNQADADADGQGDVCDADNDNDGVPNAIDNCPLVANPTQVDDDADGVGNACDNCPTTPNPLQEDANHNGIGDACETANCCTGTTGNVNMAGIVDVSDLSLLVSYLTSSPPPSLPCLGEANVNATGIVDVSDLSLLVAYLTSSPPPSLPNCP